MDPWLRRIAMAAFIALPVECVLGDPFRSATCSCTAAVAFGVCALVLALDFDRK